MSKVEPQPQTFGQLKLLILSKLEEIIFETAQLLILGSSDKAMTSLYHLFALLPPDIKKELSDIETQISQHRQKQSSISDIDPYIKFEKQTGFATTFVPFVRTSLGRIQNQLYEKYLKEGFTGLDINKAKMESYGEDEENESSMD